MLSSTGNADHTPTVYVQFDPSWKSDQSWSQYSDKLGRTSGQTSDEEASQVTFKNARQFLELRLNSEEKANKEDRLSTEESLPHPKQAKMIKIPN